MYGKEIHESMKIIDVFNDKDIEYKSNDKGCKNLLFCKYLNERCILYISWWNFANFFDKFTMKFMYFKSLVNYDKKKDKACMDLTDTKD